MSSIRILGATRDLSVCPTSGCSGAKTRQKMAWKSGHGGPTDLSPAARQRQICRRVSQC